MHIYSDEDGDDNDNDGDNHDDDDEDDDDDDDTDDEYDDDVDRFPNFCSLWIFEFQISRWALSTCLESDLFGQRWWAKYFIVHLKLEV